MAKTVQEITIRPFEESGSEDYLVYMSDIRSLEYFVCDPIVDEKEALDDLRDMIIPHPWWKAICLDDRAVGETSFHQKEGEFDQCRGEIAYILSPECWGKGILAHVLKLAVAEIFTEFEDVERIEAHIDIDNRRSQKVAEKVGFVQEGLWRKYAAMRGEEIRDCFIYSILREEYEDTMVSDEDDDEEQYRTNIYEILITS